MMLVMGIGNEMMGDDAFGPIVVKKLKDKIPDKKNIVFWSGSNPENFVGKIKNKISKLFVIDTAFLGKEAGVIEMIETSDISRNATSTHKMPLSVIIDSLGASEVYFLAVQPKNISFGDKPTRHILDASEKAVRKILDIMEV